MNNLKILLTSTFLVLLSLKSFAAPADKLGIEVDVIFSGNFGSTITDSTGTYFNINYNSFFLANTGNDPWNGEQYWITIHEPKVYVEAYHFGDPDYEFTASTTADDVLNDPDAGVPLFFFGSEAGATIAISNNGKMPVAKVTLTSEAFVLNIDGSNGESFGNKKVTEVSVPKGETVYVDASFTASVDPSLDSGLDRFSIKASFTNRGKGPDNTLGEFEAIFCPPEYTSALLGY